ncbi:MAG: DNA-directed RNA polymerase subunit beta' [bacterium]|nr:DNA-directed RNA polymerase subunit beta' [bacterium]
METRQQNFDFDAIRLRLASPDEMLAWSHGEVTKPETINYRTQKPERDGLFDEKIFGPVKDWECACGKYKRLRYKGIICDKCGVEVTRAVVRRERMGHIKLVAPVAHIWFLRGVPSNLSLVLAVSVQNLERVVYFADFIITHVNEALKADFASRIEEEFKTKRKQLAGAKNSELQRTRVAATKEGSSEADVEVAIKAESERMETQYEEKLERLEAAHITALEELDAIRPLNILSKYDYQNLSLKYGEAFEAGIGAESIYGLLEKMDLDVEIAKIEEDMAKGKLPAQSKHARRLKVLRLLRVNKIRPEWMILSVLPVIPPDLRPMVPLDGGRYASSDLNDLYRRVINRNNRLRRLIELNAPEVICRNEKRMLQEAVDALIDNSARHGKTVQAATGQRRQLRSIADTLKGKQGRFRQNLLGKRVDYSGRSVIVVGPQLNLDQVGLPKIMALELFKPFVISKLIQQGYVHNVRSAMRLIEAGTREVWDILEDITKDSVVFINRAPTLHRLSIQSFKPILIEGKAIQIHPMVCPAFNADFDGDQMAVHVPLTQEAQKEARELMLATKNILKPATGEPIAIPTQDMVWGAYYLTLITKEIPEDGKGLKVYTSRNEAWLAFDTDQLAVNEPIRVRIAGKLVTTSVGRIIFSSVIPVELRDHAKTYDKRALKELVSYSIETFGEDRTVKMLDEMKTLSFKFLTQSGLSWGVDDLPTLGAKAEVLEGAEGHIRAIEEQYADGLLTGDERHVKIVEIWTEAKNTVTKAVALSLDRSGSVSMMITSGARGSMGQITQMMGMKGLVTNPRGETIELPVKQNFKEGFDVLEYFISTHGARKGLTDTALRTANAGYLTRRLIDVAQNVIVVVDDCGTKVGIPLTKIESEEMGESLGRRVIGRVLAEPIRDPASGDVLFRRGTLVNTQQGEQINEKGIEQASVFSVLTCLTLRGVCQKCYGWDLAYNRPVALGVAVGVIAAQSIGEPGTQLTMRTFHTGGVAGQDITQGLPRVEEIFEARPVKREAVMAPESGIVRAIREEGKVRIIEFETSSVDATSIAVPEKASVKVVDGQKVAKGETLFTVGRKRTTALASGVLRVESSEAGQTIRVVSEDQRIMAIPLPRERSVMVKPGDVIERGTPLTDGSLSLQQLYALRGRDEVQRYILREIQHIYSAQGQKLNDKHIEVIVSQIFSRIMVKDPGDTQLLPGEIVPRSYFGEQNEEARGRANGAEATGEELLLGITKVSLSTESFLSAASFQETARVLINAAITGKVDKLRGLKENVIIGRLIPAGTGFIAPPKKETVEKE